jgi:hypothetical protein
LLRFIVEGVHGRFKIVFLGLFRVLVLLNGSFGELGAFIEVIGPLLDRRAVTTLAGLPKEVAIGVIGLSELIRVVVFVYTLAGHGAVAVIVGAVVQDLRGQVVLPLRVRVHLCGTLVYHLVSWARQAVCRHGSDVELVTLFSECRRLKVLVLLRCTITGSTLLLPFFLMRLTCLALRIFPIAT